MPPPAAPVPETLGPAAGKLKLNKKKPEDLFAPKDQNAQPHHAPRSGDMSFEDFMITPPKKNTKQP
jgi:hypothetical protein